jgi:S1-C subfamily serine protease
MQLDINTKLRVSEFFIFYSINISFEHIQVGGIVDQLIKFGKVTRPILGIKFAPDQSVEQLGLSGVLVLDAPPNGPAGKAGLQSTKRDSYGRLILGDIITSVNGTKVTNGSDLYRILDQCKVGEKVSFHTFL